MGTSSLALLWFGTTNRIRWLGQQRFREAIRENGPGNGSSAASSQSIFIMNLNRLNSIIFLVVIKVIVTSKIWRTMLTQIQNNANRSHDFVIFGSPLDIAIAADTKFDILFTNTFRGSRLELILGMTLFEDIWIYDFNWIFSTDKVKKVGLEKFLIICCDLTDLTEIRKDLKIARIESNCVEISWQNDGRIWMPSIIQMTSNNESFFSNRAP